jgi:nucleoside-diphosphate-sugar epimerase
MHIFVTGATGFIGSAIVQELLQAGHTVLGLARSDASAKSLAAVGADVHLGTLEDVDSLQRGAAASDGVIHTAFIHDFSAYAAAAETDRRAIEAIGNVLAGSARPFVTTAGLLGLAPGRVGTEKDKSAYSPRMSEETTMSVADKGVHASVVRLSPTVHGEGDYGFVPTLIDIARQKGVSAYVGDGANRWPAVHRLDAARLFRLVLEKGTTRASYHGAAEEGIPMRDIATVIGQQLNVPVVSKTPEEAAGHFGWIAHFAAMDAPSSSAFTQQQLGWTPSHLTLLADLNQGYYFKK